MRIRFKIEGFFSLPEGFLSIFAPFGHFLAIIGLVGYSSTVNL